jgi:RimJ/RimL family protein N-acetyltransferase
MKCKLISTDKLIRHYGYFDEDTQIGKCSIKEYSRGDLKGSYHLCNVSIDEAYRGKGLCTTFLRCVLKHYANKTVFLSVLIDNIPALKCYEKLGFKEIDKGRKTLYMRKS